MRADLTSPDQFAALVREHQAAVFRTLARLTGNGPHVEDLAQEAFLRLYRALPEFRGDATIGTYLYRIVVNLAQDEWKRRRRERTHMAAQPVPRDQDPEEASSTWLENQPADDLTDHGRTPAQRFEDAATEQIVERELACLPEIERTVLVLFHQEDVSYEGIAAALGLPLNTVRTHLHRGRKRLAERVRLALGGPAPAAPEPALTASPKQRNPHLLARAAAAFVTGGKR